MNRLARQESSGLVRRDNMIELIFDSGCHHGRKRTIGDTKMFVLIAKPVYCFQDRGAELIFAPKQL